ncbi:hypothetical protein YC2023_072655 [Brassica napus]
MEEPKRWNMKEDENSFGDFIAKSGITAEMLDSLIALKDFQGVYGLPPLSEIENIRREKSSKNLQELRQNSRFDRRLPNQVCDKWIEHGDPMEPRE